MLPGDSDTKTPPAPSVKPLSSGRNQNTTGSMVAGAAKPSSLRATGNGLGSGGFDPANARPKTPEQKRKDAARERQRRANQNQHRLAKVQNVEARKPGWKPTPRLPVQDDPRDSIYWANKVALDASLLTDQATIQNSLDANRLDFNLESQLQDEYNRRRVRDMAESRFGTGSSYSGAYRRQQKENAFDYMVDSNRRGADYANRNRELGFESNQLTDAYNENLNKLEQEGAARALDKYTRESEELAGDPSNVRPNYGPMIKNTNKRIATVRARIKDAGPEEKKRLTKQLRQLQTRRATLKGKARRDRG